MTEKKVSIIVPVYKVEEYLPKCLDSILAQSYENIEVIVIDDGSPDNSGKICDDYLKTDKKIKVIHQKNTGLSGARNTGIENSTGDYLMFIDSDDYIDKDMVSYLLEKSEQFNSDITICDYFDVVGNEIKRNEYKETEFVTKGREKYSYLFNEYTILTVIACNKLYRRHVFDGIRYPVGKTHEDEYVIAELMNNAERVCYSLKPLYYYVRQRDNSIMNTYGEKKFDFRYAFDHRISFFDEKGLKTCRDLTRYSKINMTVDRLNEYTVLARNPDREFVSKIYCRLKDEIKELAKKNNLTFKQGLKVALYNAFPGLYNKKIEQWLNKKEV